MTDNKYISLIAHARPNREITVAAFGDNQGFRPGGQLDLEVSVEEDGKWSCHDMAYRPAPDVALRAERRSFSVRLGSLPSLPEWDAYLANLDRQLSAADKREVAWTLVKVSNESESTKPPGWWMKIVDCSEPKGVASV